jgi:hypothetical protein
MRTPLKPFCRFRRQTLGSWGVEDQRLIKTRHQVLNGCHQGAHMRFPMWVSFFPLMLATRHLSRLPAYIESFTGVSIESRRELWDSKGKCIKFHTGNSKGDPCVWCYAQLPNTNRGLNERVAASWFMCTKIGRSGRCLGSQNSTMRIYC